MSDSRLDSRLEMTWAQACSRRLRRHHLIEPAEDIGAVAGAVCGVHAQVMPAAEVALGLRVAGVNRAGVREALWTDGKLVKTFGQRGTVHLFPADELGLWMSALNAVEVQRSLTPELRMTEEQREAIFDAIEKALTGTELTVDELDQEIAERAGPWASERVMPAFQEMWPRWRVLSGEAAHRGVLCFGPNRGRNITYTRPEGFTAMEGEAALAEAVLRYLHAYGPASPQEFARWFGMAPRPAAELFASLGERLVEVSLKGTDGSARRWIAAADAELSDVDHEEADLAEAPDGLRLLPYFDPYPVGCYPNELLFPGRASERALTRGQAGNVPVVLVDGTVAGVWHQRKASAKVALTVEPFIKLAPGHKEQLEAQAARIGEILEAEHTVTIGVVTAGPHA